MDLLLIPHLLLLACTHNLGWIRGQPPICLQSKRKKLIFCLRKQNHWCRNPASSIADLKEEILNFPSFQHVKNILQIFFTPSYYFHIHGQLQNQSFSSSAVPHSNTPARRLIINALCRCSPYLHSLNTAKDSLFTPKLPQFLGTTVKCMLWYPMVWQNQPAKAWGYSLTTLAGRRQGECSIITHPTVSSRPQTQRQQRQSLGETVAILEKVRKNHSCSPTSLLPELPFLPDRLQLFWETVMSEIQRTTRVFLVGRLLKLQWRKDRGKTVPAAKENYHCQTNKCS